jgi:hypothetical protein
MDYLGKWGGGGPGHSWALKWQRAKKRRKFERSTYITDVVGLVLRHFKSYLRAITVRNEQNKGI